MGVQNLRETVYFQRERILDEGYWDGPLGGPGEHYAELYNSKDTFVDGEGYIVTLWESDYAILKRTADLASDGCALKYELWLKAFGYEPDPEPVAEIGVGVLWNVEPRVGTPEESLSYILARMESYYDEYANSYKGITAPGLSLMINYTFDDTIKHVSDHSLIAWDGATPPEYIREGISYEDPEFSPLTTGLPRQRYGSKAIWGMVHLPTPNEFSVTTGQFVEEVWQGVGVTGKYSQETCAKYVKILATIDIEPDVVKLSSKAKFLTCYITLPSDFDLYDIDLSTVLLKDDPDENPYPEPAGPVRGALMVKFDMAKVKNYILDDLLGGIPPSDWVDVTLHITGSLYDGTPFAGSDRIRVR